VSNIVGVRVPPSAPTRNLVEKQAPRHGCPVDSRVAAMAPDRATNRLGRAPILNPKVLLVRKTAPVASRGFDRPPDRASLGTDA
jgi:hypothetical protein